MSNNLVGSMLKLVLKLALLFTLLPRGLVLASVESSNSSASVTYYVTPADTTTCPDGSEPCHNLDYYITNSSEFFSPDKSNVTMIFLSGTHATTKEAFEVIHLARLNIIGGSHSMIMGSIFSSWSIKGTEFHVENLTIAGIKLNIEVAFLHMSLVVSERNTEFKIQPPLDELGKIVTVDAELIECKFKDHSFIKTTRINNITLHNCEFLNVSLTSTINPLTVYHSKVFFTGTSNFIGANQTAILAFISDITLYGTVKFVNNSGVNGGALALYSTTMFIDNAVNVSFVSNFARQQGGAIFVDSGVIQRPDSEFGQIPCFYQILHPLHSTVTNFSLYFANNFANAGGDNIYGTSLQNNCQISMLNINSSFYSNVLGHFHFQSGNLTSVSSDPTRVCICNSNGKPQCADIAKIFMTRTAYPGETIKVSAAVVGGDFGTTPGILFSGVLNQGLQDNHKATGLCCTDIELLVRSRTSLDTNTTIFLSTLPYYDDEQYQSNYHNKNDIREDIRIYERNQTISVALRSTPVFIDITFLPCPPGYVFTPTYDYVYDNLYSDKYPSRVSNYYCDSIIPDGIGNTGWIGVVNDSIIYSENCPFGYCHGVDPMDESTYDDQCSFNRNGILCGGCKENYTLAIGSSRCIECSNNNSLALIIFFAAAGFLLVLFISILNLTVAQGMINGLIVYANIVWSYKGFFLPLDDGYYNTDGLVFLKIFLAWLNLDFGIETCFIQGLNSFWRTWLQFVFPFYTAGLFFIGLRFSSKLSKLFGNRSVPTLATLLFMSYTKLFRTIIAALGLAQLKIKFLSTNSSETEPVIMHVWSVDGNLEYGKIPHIFLVLAALACLLLLWLPYTLLLLLMQCLRKAHSFKVSQWITRYKPVFDAYYAPLNDKHHYWFAVLLLSEGVVLLTSSLLSNLGETFNVYISLFLPLIIAIVLLFYMNLMQVYRRKAVLVTESLFFINIILFITGVIAIVSFQSTGTVIVPWAFYTSVFVAFLEFCGIVLGNIIPVIYSKCRKYRNRKMTKNTSPIEEEKGSTAPTSSYVRLRDSILDDSLTNGVELH